MIEYKDSSYVFNEFVRKFGSITDSEERMWESDKYAFTLIRLCYSEWPNENDDEGLLAAIKNILDASIEIAENPKYNATGNNSNLVDRDVVLSEINQILVKHGFYK